MKGKGGKERYPLLKAEFQGITRKDEKAFLSDQCKEIEENNRMGKIEISSRKLEMIREQLMHNKRCAQWRTQMGTIKDRSSMVLTEAEDIKKRWLEDTEELS